VKVRFRISRSPSSFKVMGLISRSRQRKSGRARVCALLGHMFNYVRFFMFCCQFLLHQNDDDDDANKSISEESESDLCRNETYPEDRCSTSSMIEHQDLLSANTGTENNSTVSLSSPDAGRLSANTSECETSSVLSARPYTIYFPDSKTAVRLWL